ncbi:hypothetical protein PR202_ga05739 [Eleusine coracana subsp. coracana]|uniref:DC-UbP/UBTD2 N-terminal domain-containing protein n=1 Tax=Eleusine coracana subsp. coracana TaxID=191504 RepID=A0AAV5BU86_ELECO|nr:hypothetical protein PR202_ga05739 [Eleusine coracana subsp. coracana]
MGRGDVAGHLVCVGDVTFTGPFLSGFALCTGSHHMPLMLRVSYSSRFHLLIHRSLPAHSPRPTRREIQLRFQKVLEGPLHERLIAMVVKTFLMDTENSKKLKKPKPWKHSEPITLAQLKQMRDEFWDTAPHYGGQKEIWDALRVAAESDLTLAQTIVDSAGIIISNPDMTLCYDERGAKYELPKYVLSEPTNLIRDA